MELPPEIVDIIRQYSKPYMRFAKEFNAAKSDYEKVSQIPKLVDAVKAKLYTKDAPQVIEVFVAFVEASVATRKAQDIIALKTYRQDPDVWLECVNSIMHHMMRREKLTKDLFMIVYGQYD
jgi:hypothetical protein